MSDRAKRVLLIRPDRAADDALSLTNAGFEVVVEPWLVVRPVVDAAPARRLTQALTQSRSGDYLIITSPRTWAAWSSLIKDDLESIINAALERGLKIITTGQVTADSLPFAFVTTASRPSARGILDDLAKKPAATAFLPASAIANPRLSDKLANLGWRVIKASVYETRVVEQRPASADDLEAGRFDAVIVRSTSAVEALARHCPDGIRGCVVALGQSSASAASKLAARVVTSEWTHAKDLPRIVNEAVQ